MKNRLKELRLKKNVTITELCKAIEYNGIKFSEQEIRDLETGEPEGFNLDALFKASGFLHVPFHEMLYIPIEGYEEIAEHGDDTLLAAAVCFVLEGWFDASYVRPNKKQIGQWATKIYHDTIRLNLNFTETREYGHAIVRPDFDLNAVATMEKYLNLRDY
jgi:transcriptional regulator with XRE-family HTH domain